MLYSSREAGMSISLIEKSENKCASNSGKQMNATPQYLVRFYCTHIWWTRFPGLYSDGPEKIWILLHLVITPQTQEASWLTKLSSHPQKAWHLTGHFCLWSKTSHIELNYHHMLIKAWYLTLLWATWILGQHFSLSTLLFSNPWTNFPHSKPETVSHPI
jgi:hypothetical protein